MLLLTIGLLIVLIIISYIIFDRDVLAPPTVVSMGLFFSTVCAYYNEEKWGLHFSDITTFTIVAGVSFFILGSMLAVLLSNISHINRVGFSHKAYSITPLSIKTSKTLLIIIFELATVVLLYSELRNITGQSNWLDIIVTYRLQTATVDPNEYVMHLSSFVKLCIDLSFAIALVYSYVIGNNIALRKKHSFLNWLPVILSCLMGFMQGYRSDMIRLWVAIIVVAFTLKKRSTGWAGGKDIKRLVKKMALSVLTVAVIFAALRGAVGRSDTETDPLYYVTFYAGCPVALFDIFLKDPLPPSDIWGKETFYNLNQSIGVWTGNSKLRYIFYKEFRKSPNGTYIGNVYTALRPPYYDFGFGGMIIVLFLMGAFFTFLYCKVRTPYGKSPIDFRLLLYSYISYTFFMYFYNCYNGFIGLGFVKLIIELLAVRWFLLDVHFKALAASREAG